MEAASVKTAPEPPSDASWGFFEGGNAGAENPATTDSRKEDTAPDIMFASNFCATRKYNPQSFFGN